MLGKWLDNSERMAAFVQAEIITTGEADAMLWHLISPEHVMLTK